MNKLTTRSGWWEFQGVVQDREEFRTYGQFYAVRPPASGVYYSSLGRLPEEYRDSVQKADYVIFSYSTPIAWHGPDGWTFPDEKYSVTTSRHQGKIFFIKDWI